MLCKRIVPTILVRGKTAYKGPGFGAQCTRSVGSALAIAKVHARRGVDELCILDISATAEGRGPDLDLVRELSEGCFVPITVGGGVRTVDDVNQLLRAGADKVCIGRGAWGISGLVSAAASRFGRQAVVVSVDAPESWPQHKGIYSHFGLGQVTTKWPIELAQFCSEMGAGEILLQSIARDGTMQGYDLDLIHEVSAAVSIPVIASGGCRDYSDMLAAFKAGADACAAGAIFAFTDATPRGAAQFLQRNNIEVRL